MVKPPDDLRQWSKRDLEREVERLRAITREHSEQIGGDARAASVQDAVLDIAGDPHARGGAVLDARGSVLLDDMNVVLVDTKRNEPLSMMMTLAGRINYADDRVEHAYLFGPDGAAALVSELVGLASRAIAVPDHGERFATEFRELLDKRMARLP